MTKKIYQIQPREFELLFNIVIVNIRSVNRITNVIDMCRLLISDPCRQ